MSCWGHYRVLVWKNWLLWKRHLCASICECCCPIALIAFILILRVSSPATDQDPKSYLITPQGVGELISVNNNSVTFTEDGTDFTYASPFQWCEQVLQYGWVAAIVPSGSALGAHIATHLQADMNIPVQYFPTESALEDFITSSSYENPGIRKLCFAVVIDAETPLKLAYKLRFNATSTDPNDQSVYGSWWDVFSTAFFDPVNAFQRNVVTDYQRDLMSSGFMQLMSWATEYYLQTVNPKAELTAALVPMHGMAWVDDPFSGLGGMIGFFMFISTLIPITRQISKMANEKETKMKETMKMMGLTDTPYWLSWYTLYISFYLVVSLICTGLSIPIFPYSDKGIVFLLFFLYGMSCMTYAMLITAFFTKAKTAMFVGVVVFFISYFTTLGNTPTTPDSTLMGLSMFCPVAMVQGFSVLVGLESVQIGSNINNLDMKYQNYSVQTALVFLIVDNIVYGLLAFYVDKVMPSEFGTNLPWYFPVSPTYWRGRTISPISETTKNELEEGYQKSIETMKKARRVETVDSSLLRQHETGQAMLVRGLKKRFGNKVAVDGVDLDIYEGQIFALLGHNGAGKTTTLSMLTGLIEASAGEMTVHGHSFRESMESIRKELGMCPQHDVLFPDLTVQEHLYMFSVFKGMRKHSEIQEKIDEKIAEIDLGEKRNTPAMNLSGGQKRKLSLAMALIGGSPIVMLDEPTSGMDLTARRRMWDMLKNEKNKRIIILTTHYMEEADILADRVAIMSEGKVRCVGSPLFLKHRYGVGYVLTIAKKMNISSAAHSSKVTSFLKVHIPEVIVLNDVSAEIQFQLPLSSTAQFQALFEDLDRSLAELELEQYGISVTTLEEVFLKVARGDEEVGETGVDSPVKQANVRLKGLSMRDRSAFENETYPEEFLTSNEAKEPLFQLQRNCPLFSHLFALLQKRYWYSIRDYKALVCEIFLPVIVVLIGLALLGGYSVFGNQPQYDLTIGQYPPSQQLLYNSDNSDPTIFSIMNMMAVNTGATVSAIRNDSSFADFDGEVYNARFHVPYHMGAFYFAEANDVTHQYQVAVFQNTTGYQASGTFFNLLTQGLLAHLLNPSFSVSCSNYPLPLTSKQSVLARNTGTFYIALIFAVGMALIPTSLIILIVKEKETSVKHQLVVSGVSIPAYWFSYYIWDMVKHLIPAVLCSAFIKAFSLQSLTDNTEAYGTAWILFLLFGLAVIPFTYLCSFLFKSASMAQFVVFMFSLVTGAILATASWMMRLLSGVSRDINQYLQYIFRISPIYCFAYGIMNASNREAYAAVFGENTKRNALDWNIAGADVIYLAVESAVYTLLLFLVEWSRNLHRLRQVGGAIDPGETKYQEDDDVEREKKEAAEAVPESVAVKVAELRQIYKGKVVKVAIEDVSFLIHKSECFALLGVNGAGKTSTFRILTGENVPTRGTAHIGGSSIQTDMAEARYKIGYCPQFDALNELLTPFEHLRLYARIKGVPNHLIKVYAKQNLINMGLEQYADVRAGTLSGGNKRKLSVAIACIGNPPVIFLDEPSAGMDPEARKKMWKVINDIKSKQTSIILTTHSMEEAEALCDRIAIMVAGRIRCLGTSTHIKNKFGSVRLMQGYELFLKVKSPEPDQIQRLIDQLHAVIGNLEVVTADKVQECCTRLGREDFAEEVSERGSGAGLWQQLQTDKSVDVLSFAEWFSIELAGSRVLAWLLSCFKGVTLVEHYVTFYKFKLEKEERQSLGYLFGELEAQKEQLGICEYSLSQTTLEQIFNMFATQTYETERLARRLTKVHP